MTETSGSDLFDDIVVPALGSLKVALWGEMAMVQLGVQIVYNKYMLVPHEADFEEALQRLKAAGCEETSWSYGLSDDPARFEHNKRIANAHKTLARKYQRIDEESVRLTIPHDSEHPTRVILVHSDYVGLSPPADEDEMERFYQYKESNVYCPDHALLLESFIRVSLQETSYSLWKSTLDVWCITYMYSQLMLDDDILDECEDERIKWWFNTAIERDTGGIDRITVSKRVGRVF